MLEFLLQKQQMHAFDSAINATISANVGFMIQEVVIHDSWFFWNQYVTLPRRNMFEKRQSHLAFQRFGEFMIPRGGFMRFTLSTIVCLCAVACLCGCVCLCVCVCVSRRVFVYCYVCVLVSVCSCVFVHLCA